MAGRHGDITAAGGDGPGHDTGFSLLKAPALGLLSPMVIAAERAQIALAGPATLVVRQGVVLVAAPGRAPAPGEGAARAARLDEMAQPRTQLVAGAFVPMPAIPDSDGGNRERQAVRDSRERRQENGSRPAGISRWSAAITARRSAAAFAAAMPKGSSIWVRDRQAPGCEWIAGGGGNDGADKVRVQRPEPRRLTRMVARWRRVVNGTVRFIRAAKPSGTAAAGPPAAPDGAPDGAPAESSPDSGSRAGRGRSRRKSRYARARSSSIVPVSPAARSSWARSVIR